MIVLDTNVLSALMRGDPERVLAWIDEQPQESIWTTAITIFEVRFGLARLPSGRRRKGLERSFDQAIRDLLGERVLNLDRLAADAAGVMGAAQQSQGRSIEIRDLLIAGIVVSRKATLATRNVRHFEGLEIVLVDPWSAPK